MPRWNGNSLRVFATAEDVGSLSQAAVLRCPVFTLTVAVASTSFTILEEMDEERSGSAVSGTESPPFLRISALSPLSD